MLDKIIIPLVTGYILILSLLGFVLMGVDKHKARKKAWRIPEKTLILVALLGGGIGSFVGMYVFHHKTKHAKFFVLLPLIAGLYLAGMLKLYNII